MENEEMVTITRAEYDGLRDSEAILIALENAGVDNWSYYDEAMDEYRAGLEEE